LAFGISLKVKVLCQGYSSNLRHWDAPGGNETGPKTMVKRVKPVCSSRTKPGLPGESGWVAAAVGLVCLGGMTKPADAYSSYYGYSDIYSRRQFGDTMLPASHRSRKHTDSDKKSPPGKNEQAAKKEQPKPPAGPLIIVVSIGSQHVTVYDNGTPIATAPVSTGMPGHPTPMGVFSVIQKDRYHHSNIYSNAPMPFMQRITWSGVAMHEGVVPGHPASHGCIRLPHEFAQRLWGMTKMGVRVVVTPRNDVVPVEIDHPRLVAMATKPANPNVAVTPSHTGQASPAALPAFTSLAPPSVAPQSSAAAPTAPLGEGIDASGDSPLPPLEALVLDQRPGDLRPALVTFADPPAAPAAPVAPAAAIPERPLKPGLVSVFVSRKLGKLFVRKGNEPIFDMPVKIAHPETPIGTYVFTAAQSTGEGSKPHWLAMSVASGQAIVEPPSRSQEAKGKTRGAREVKPAPAPAISPTSATAALDRIEIPPEALELISPLVTPGASLIVSDQGISGETGKDTDFIVLVR
jgi:lipoprotein-anchoring transpeptidase ErfK/SrfK